MLKLRFYSVSSSPKVSSNSVSITVGLVGSTTPGGRRHYGVCSDFLNRCAPGQVLRVLLKDTKSTFRLPADPKVPIILVGPGTGFAPMRGFLQERHATKAPGQNLLFFGCRDDDDFIYRTEIESYPTQGQTTLHVAFSRKQEHKIYVQDKLLENGETVWDALAKGGHVYVCGDAKYMAKDVRQALGKIVTTYGNMNETLAEEFLTHLSFSKRYCQDVWASPS